MFIVLELVEGISAVIQATPSSLITCQVISPVFLFPEKSFVGIVPLKIQIIHIFNISLPKLQSCLKFKEVGKPFNYIF